MADPPIDPEYLALLDELARLLDGICNGEERPRRIGFALFMFELDKIEPNRVNYISNIERASMIAAVKECVARAEGRAAPAPARQQ